MKKYGFFGGSFNPVTVAHLNLAKIVLREYNLDKVIFVPMGDCYKKSGLAKEELRFEMLRIATQNDERLEVSDVELNLSKPLTMLQAFEKIEKAYKNIKPYFIIGADNLNKLINLDDFKQLATDYEYIVIDRQGVKLKEIIASNNVLTEDKANFNILENNPYKEVSATDIRNGIKQNNKEKIRELIPQQLHNYLKEKKLYKL